MITRLGALSLVTISLAAGSLTHGASAAAQQTAPVSPSPATAAAPRPEPPAGAEGGLERAYKKEFAFLGAQRRELKQRIEQMDTTAREEASDVGNQIERLEGELLALNAQGDRLQEQLEEAERAADTNAGSRETLEAVFDQAGTTLTKHGHALIDTDDFKALDDEAKIGKLFAVTSNVVSGLSGLRQTPGAFYLRDGTKTSGTVIRVGNIAAYGVSEAGSGALAPAGGGQMKLWTLPAADVAQALARNEQPDPLKVFLYESLDKQVTEDQNQTLLQHVDSGGLIGWLIVALGGLALLLILLRAAFLKSASTSTGDVLNSVGELVKQGDLNKALEECHRSKGSTGRVLAATIRNLDRDREHLEDIVSESILNESGHLNRFGAFILVLAAVAPLLGLLGTVTGMIQTFDIITVFGTGDPKLLSGGISVALVTTELGLAVAIPALVLGHLLSGWSERIKDDMEKAALRVTNLYHQTKAAA
ncbi:MAG: MotA/TolQ/ExbB proton channel family protein [Nitrospirota bacterium]